MDRIKMSGLVLSALSLIFALPEVVWANKASVSMVAPVSAAPGQEVVITVKVTHDGNSPVHYVNRVYLKINGNEIKTWEYTPLKRPDSGDFSLTYKYRVGADAKLTAEANCNLHGSAGPGNALIKAKQ
jgi:desulfoferrodoxin (superoxide reductase-like protein)